MPISEEEYLDWHRESLGEDLVSDQVRREYELNQAALFANLNSHRLTQSLSELLKELTDSGLFLKLNENGPDLKFEKKPYRSVVNKIYRVNHVWNRRWTKPPRGDWVTAKRCFSQLDDTIRSTIVCRYVDGPEQVSSRICEIATSLGLEVNCGPRATDEGYYAWHVYVTINFDILMDGRVVNQPFIFEVQIMTVLQYTLKELTHRFYEEARVERGDRTAARWDFASDRFKGMYLGHALHLVDAMIVELRDRHSHWDGAAEVESPTTVDQLQEQKSGTEDSAR